MVTFGDVFFGVCHSTIARRWSLSIKMAVPKFRRNWPGLRAPILHKYISLGSGK